MKNQKELIRFLLKLQIKCGHRESGMGMFLVSVIVTMIFVLMSTYLVIVNIGTKTTQAHADLSNIFS